MNHYNIELQVSVVSFCDTPENAAKMIYKMRDRLKGAVIFINGADGTYGKRII